MLQNKQSRLCLILIVLGAVSPSYAKVDLSGMYDVGTLTPLERPAMYGNSLFLTPDEANMIEQQFAARLQRANASSDPERTAPESGQGWRLQHVLARYRGICV